MKEKPMPTQEERQPTVPLSTHDWARAQLAGLTAGGCDVAAEMSGAASWSASQLVLNLWLQADAAGVFESHLVARREWTPPTDGAVWVISDMFVRDQVRVSNPTLRSAVAAWVLSVPDEVHQLVARAPIPTSADY